MPTVRRAAETYICAFSTTQQRKKRRNYVLPSQLVKKVPHGTFLTALSAEHFELVQNAIFRKPCYSKVFGGGLFYLRRALPPQTPPAAHLSKRTALLFDRLRGGTASSPLLIFILYPALQRDGQPSLSGGAAHLCQRRLAQSPHGDAVALL